MRPKGRRAKDTMNTGQVAGGIIDHLPQPTFVLDCNGRVKTWNRGMELLTGVRAERIVGRGDYEHGLILFGTRRPTLNNYILKPGEEWRGEYRLIRQDGEFLFAESQKPLVNGRFTMSVAGPLYGSEGDLVGAIESLCDISDTKLTRNSFRNSEEDLKNPEESLPDIMFTIDADGTYLQFFWMDAESFGTDPALMPGKTPYDILPWEEADYIVQAARQVIATGKPVSVERCFLWHGEERTIQTALHPLRDTSGRITAATGISRDATAMVRSRKALDETRQAAEMYLDLLGNDIYNANMVASTVIEMLKERLSGEEEELAQRIKNTLEQNITVIKNVELLNTLNRYRVSMEPVNLDEIVAAQIKRYPGINITYSGCSCPVWANELLDHVFANLISNSIKYGGMKVRIEISVVEMEDIVTVTVADNGIGIPDHLKPNIFDRFTKSGKKRGGSRGLGLHIVKTLIGHYGGRVWAADRVPGRSKEGAAIKLILQKC
ncbi:sensory box histidine kinase/response regulator [hydrocarbon metagenome]|uniref:histidine kinase n=1 Tax=hydrocarbon metagenome TaxID=938273 RepID=A0A0W8FJJ7_9ZZZZ